VKPIWGITEGGAVRNDWFFHPMVCALSLPTITGPLYRYPNADNPQAGVFIHRQIANLVGQGVSCRVLLCQPAPPPFPRWLVRRTWVKHYWKKAFWPDTVDGVPVETVSYRRTWQPDQDVVPAMAESLVRYVETHPACQATDIVYAHFLWPAGAAALALRERFGWPVTGIARGSEMHEWQELKPYCREHVARFLETADGVLANCQDLRQRAAGLNPARAAAMDVIYNGCDAQKFRPGADKTRLRQSLQLNPSRQVLFFCGSLEARKGIDELAEAWQHFATAHADWDLLVAGPVLETSLAARLQAAPRVTCLGKLATDRLLQYYQAADAYIQPSRLEGLANATMEAMAVGLPVISTDTCGQTELITHGVNGWLVPVSNPLALRQALEAFAADPSLRARLGAQARRTIQEKFDPLAQAARLAEWLRRVHANSEVAPGRPVACSDFAC
jgi:glycosyltransferase involved in cell wall biosynthesis